MAKAKKSAEVAEMTVAEKLKALYDLQLVDTAIDKITDPARGAAPGSSGP